MNRTLVIAMAAVAAGLVVAIGVLYVYGTPQAAPVPLDAAPSEDASVAVVGTDETAVEAPQPTSDEVPAPDPNSPLAIEIPGCKCHSDDPKLVKEHEGYRMNQCAGCHAGQVPTGQ